MVRTMPSMQALERDQALKKPAYRILTEKFGEKILRVTEYRGDLAITVDLSAWKEAARTLRDHPELDYKLFLDLCGVDYLNDESRPDRFEVAPVVGGAKHLLPEFLREDPVRGFGERLVALEGLHARHGENRSPARRALR